MESIARMMTDTLLKISFCSGVKRSDVEESEVKGSDIEESEI